MIKKLNYNLNIQSQEKILDENSSYIWKEDSYGCEGQFIPTSNIEGLNTLEYIEKTIAPSTIMQIFNSEKVLDRICIQNDGNNDLLFNIGVNESSNLSDFNIKISKKESIVIQGTKLNRMKDLWCYSSLGTSITFLLYSAVFQKNVITSAGYDSQLKDSNNNIIIAF